MYQWWRQRVKHEEWDVNWLHRSKWDVLEARGISRKNLGKYPEGEVMEVQVYGKKMYLDEELFNIYIDNKETNGN